MSEQLLCYPLRLTFKLVIFYLLTIKILLFYFHYINFIFYNVILIYYHYNLTFLILPRWVLLLLDRPFQTYSYSILKVRHPHKLQ